MVDFRVIGVGSPHGDDQAGWRLVEFLEGRELPNTEVIAVRGGSSIIDCLRDCRTAILVDACRSGATPGTITRLVWPDPRVSLQHDRSTHGFGIAGALALAQRLDALPKNVVVYGVEALASEPETVLSPSVEAVLPELANRVVGELATPPNDELRRHDR